MPQVLYAGQVFSRLSLKASQSGLEPAASNGQNFGVRRYQAPARGTPLITLDSNQEPRD